MNVMRKTPSGEENLLPLTFYYKLSLCERCSRIITAPLHGRYVSSEITLRPSHGTIFERIYAGVTVEIRR